jgi:uncharacterized protein DUF3383
VSINSAVGGEGVVRQRELILRVMTENPLVPTQSYIEFTTAAAVGQYFTTTSTEYAYALFYFGWVNKTANSPQKISFARWANAATAPEIFGDPTVVQSVALWTPITAGSFTLTIGSNSYTLSSLNFSGVSTLAGVATIVQAAINAESGGGAVWTGATVTYDATRGCFDFVGGSAAPNVITVTAGTGGSDIAAQLGWLSPGTIISNGVAAETLTQTLTNTATYSNNFLSLAFIPTLNLTQVEQVAAWVNSQNFVFMYCLPVTAANASSWYTALASYAGVAMTLSPIAGQYPEIIPAMIAAATDYTKQNSVQNYMFQLNFAGITASVTDLLTAQTYDNERTNYYGNTQTAGQVLSFYQRGTLMGGTNAATDQNVYVNEAWLKDAAGTSLMSLLLALPVVSANVTGQAQITGTLQAGVIAPAIFNGIISVGKTLNTTEIQYITSITGSQKAWYQVQTIGYWLNTSIQSYVTVDNRTEYEIIYTLIYADDQAIRKVVGSHILI